MHESEISKTSVDGRFDEGKFSLAKPAESSKRAVEARCLRA
jgi:hypothetical protein